jgi:Fe-S oxidoreductase
MTSAAGESGSGKAAVAPANQTPGWRGPLLFLGDSFSSYTEPEIGKAAIELLEAAGWNVRLVDNVCCGRSFISKGLLPEAKREHARLLRVLAPHAREGIPIVGCEPSCVLTLKDEIPSLAGHSDDSLAVAKQVLLADELIAQALEDGSLVPDPDSEIAGRRIVFHGHCHQKAASALPASVRILSRIPGAQVDVLDAGCCGMAGSFGFEAEHYELSMKVGGLRLFPAIKGAPADSVFAATGVSCRQQIAQGTGKVANHPIVLLRSAVRIA